MSQVIKQEFKTGMIIMWSGLIANIPAGWYLCNGSNGTPDLRNRMIICADADSGGAAKTTVEGAATQSGGAATHTNTLDELVPHTHDITLDISTSFNGTGSAPGVGTSSSDGSQTTTSTGSGTAYSIMNPYYALALIMKG